MTTPSSGVTGSPVVGTTSTFPPIVYEQHGSVGAPVIMVMGFGMRGAVWAPQVQDLRQDHRVVTLDNRGIGQSAYAPRGPLFMRHMAEDVLRVMDSAGFTDAHVVGVSMGGMISQELALRAPERVRSLALIATHPGGPRALPTPTALRLLAKAFSRSPKDRADAFFELLYPPEFVRTVDRKVLLARAREQFGKPADPAVVLAQATAIAMHDTRRRLHRLHVPTLVVRPDLDVLVSPTQSDEIATRLPNARLVRFPDAGHGVTFQKAAELNALLREHLEHADLRRSSR